MQVVRWEGKAAVVVVLETAEAGSEVLVVMVGSGEARAAEEAAEAKAAAAAAEAAEAKAAAEAHRASAGVVV